jgi:hypothetical protein
VGGGDVTQNNGGVVRAPSKVIRIVIDRTNYTLFKMLPTARELSPAQVSKLLDLMRSGRHFLTPMAVNETTKSGKKSYVVIDGGHRLAAIGKVIDEDPNFRIEVEFHVFDHLNDQESRAVFDAWNENLRQTQMSRLWVNQRDYPIVALLHKDFPIKVTFEQSVGKGAAFRASPLLIGIGSWGKAYLRAGGKEFYRSVAEIEPADHALAKEFASDFLSAFGEPGYANPFSKSAPVIALLRVWRANVPPGLNGDTGEKIGREETVRRWKSHLAENPTARQRILSLRGTAASSQVEGVIVEVMNRGEGRLVATAPSSVWRGRASKPTQKVVLSGTEWARYLPLLKAAHADVLARAGRVTARSNLAVLRRFRSMFPDEAASLDRRATTGAIAQKISRVRKSWEGEAADV